MYSKLSTMEKNVASAFGEKQNIVEIGELTLKRQWRFRTAAPQRVLGVLSDTIKGLGYTVQETQPLESEQSEISDMVTFAGEIIGNKRTLYISRWPSVLEVVLVVIALTLLAVSFNWVMIVVAIILILLTIILLLVASQTYTRVLAARLEGEAHEAAFKVRVGGGAKEAVSDTSLVIAGAVKNKHDELIEGPEEQRILKKDFATFTTKVETMLPSFIVRWLP